MSKNMYMTLFTSRQIERCVTLHISTFHKYNIRNRRVANLDCIGYTHHQHLSEHKFEIHYLHITCNVTKEIRNKFKTSTYLKSKREGGRYDVLRSSNKLCPPSR